MIKQGDLNALYEQAKSIVITHRKASIALVQRELRIRYTEAATLMEMLEKNGVVSHMHLDGLRIVLSAGDKQKGGAA